MVTIALRFIPTLLVELDTIMRAQRARGADFRSGGLRERARALVPVLIPLFVLSFRRADDLALAMEARCYRPGIVRTRLHPLQARRRRRAAAASSPRRSSSSGCLCRMPGVNEPRIERPAPERCRRRRDRLAPRSGVRRHGLPRLGAAARPADGGGGARGGARDRARRAGAPQRRRAHRRRRARVGAGGVVRHGAPRPAAGPAAPLAERAAAARRRRRGGGAGAGRLRGAAGELALVRVPPVARAVQAGARALLGVGACAARSTRRCSPRPPRCCRGAGTSPPSRPPRTCITAACAR